MLKELQNPKNKTDGQIKELMDKLDKKSLSINWKRCPNKMNSRIKSLDRLMELMKQLELERKGSGQETQ